MPLELRCRSSKHSACSALTPLELVRIARVKPRVGDIGHRPQGRCLCVFFGPTPASRGPEPAPASPVAVVGGTGASPDLLRSIRDGEEIIVSAG